MTAHKQPRLFSADIIYGKKVMVALNNRGYLSLRAVVKSYRIHLLEIHGERCNLVYKRIVQFEKTGNIMEIAVVARTIASCSIS